MRAVIFDLDNTLAKLGKAIEKKDLMLLQKLEKQGNTIAICSGKTVDYLCGFARQIELERPVLIGENGAVIQIGVDLPPKHFYELPYSDKAKESIAFLRSELNKILPHIWYQPNKVGLTPFPSGPEEFKIIAECIEKNKEQIQDVVIYQHIDSFDIVPKGIDKRKGIAFLGKLLDMTMEDMAAVGDGVNDYPMFECVGLSIGINVREAKRVDKNFRTITEALEYLLTVE